MASSKNDRESRAARERLRVYEARQTVHRTQLRRRRLDNVLAVVIGAVLVAAASVAQVGYFTAGPGAPKTKPSASASASATASPSASAGTNVGDVPDPSTAEGKSWSGVLTINGIKMDYTLDGATAPQGVAVWLQEVSQKYFVDKTCHRVITGQLIQCGSEDGTGGTETDFSYGPIENAPTDGVYPAGTIALARSGDDAYSQGHQFFITTSAVTLPNDSAGGYTVLGTITSNLSELATKIVDKGITGTESAAGGGTPKVATKIDAVTIAAS